MEEIRITEIAYADDMVIIARDEEAMNENLRIYNESLGKINMSINEDNDYK